MCGIIGAASKINVTRLLLDGLKRLEYRGYDSAGIAVISPDGQLLRIRIAGKVQTLINETENHHVEGNTGIAHTRWATHGKPSENNAHPHTAGNTIAMVHNGIIENHEFLRHHLLTEGCDLSSDTDSELIAHLIYQKIKTGSDILTGVRSLTTLLKGTYAIGVISKNEPGRLIALRFSSPLVIGIGKDGIFISSDTLALRPIASEFIYLEDGDIADINKDNVTIYDSSGNKVNRTRHKNSSPHDTPSKENYPHYMLKEIFEQPDSMSRALQSRMTASHVLTEAFGVNAPEIFTHVKRIQIIACGTSYHAGLVSKFWFEELIHIPCEVDIASEYRYRHPVIESGTLFITLSQSGETADTLEGLRQAKSHGYLSTLTICNVAESSIVRESDMALLMDAGSEIGVASTKSFTSQLEALFLLVLSIGQAQGMDQQTTSYLIKEISSLPSHAAKILSLDNEIKVIAAEFKNKQNCFFIGRGILFPVAMEGALKLKEISYIHAEAFPAGELKHGPIALIDPIVPVIALAQNDNMIEKIKSSLEEILSRGGNIVLLTGKHSGMENRKGITTLAMPHVSRFLTPIIYVIPLQLLAYHVAVAKGADVDQPRNLAKSVTVE